MSYSEIEARAWGASKKDLQAFENRAYYEDDLDKIFKKVEKEDRPDIPSGLCASIINKLVSHVFPEETGIQAGNEKLADPLKAILEDTKLLEKLALIGQEGHITGTVGLKSIYDPFNQKWTLDIHCVEALEIDFDPLDTERVFAIRIRFRFVQSDPTGQEKEYWYQERWTDFDYTEWMPQEVIKGQIPNFTEAMVNTEASGLHPYGEIPITLIQHKIQLDTPYGAAEIDDKMKAYSRKLSVSMSKTGWADQLIQTPAYIRKNDMNKDTVRIQPGAVIDIDSEGENDTDFSALEHTPTPESSFQYQKDLENKAYDSAQVTSPNVEKEMKAGGTFSSLAWKAFNLPFIKKVKELRKRYADKGVESHIEKLFRMGKTLKLSGYEAVNPEDITTYEVEMVFPPFFEPTVEEKTAEIGLLQISHLPAEELGRRIAAVHNITREELITEIIANIESERAALEPSVPGNGGE